MNDQRTETQKGLDEHLFHLELNSRIPAFAWLYLIGDRTIQIHYDSELRGALPTNSISPLQVTLFAKSANKTEIIKHGIADKFLLGLILVWGDRDLAACNIDPENNRIILFTAEQTNET